LECPDIRVSYRFRPKAQRRCSGNINKRRYDIPTGLRDKPQNEGVVMMSPLVQRNLALNAPN
ncbi:MAG: hypothetical protein UDS26_02890, partial [Collinsella sp.]|nr:hypothetical protein [Collinsella sp.]